MGPRWPKASCTFSPVTPVRTLKGRLSKPGSESEKTEDAVHLRSLFTPCGGANRTETVKGKLVETFVPMEPKQSAPAANLGLRFCIQVRGQSFWGRKVWC